MEKSTKNNVDFKAVFKETLNSMTLIPLMISGGRSNVTTRCNSNITLTDMRAQYASRVLSNIFAYKDQNTEIILTSIKNSDNKSLSSTITCVVGPVINPSTKKKDVTTSFEEYMRLRQLHVKSRHPTEGKSMSEAWITEAVISYDFLHNDTTKPMHAVGLAGLEIDPQFREAIKVLYNRSRVACILQKFSDGVDCSLYPPLPSLDTTNFKLLKHKAEIEITSKYIAGFVPMLNKFSLTRIAKITSELWRFLLFLSQDYSHYYSSVRTLCDEHNRSHPTMHARIWMLKVILTIYDAAFAILNLKPLQYV
ncbi:DALR anticodon-binding domain-containing protein 3-like [Daphnia pulex]|uniref:DALR anticodon-binding domain-containing protein 3-like n=1 Tax=Daphnia pulex TaxID=6669 RepID=UPI001EDD366C|nr:DALR anticodon-binding domain-containing protein 3-like [Daphnia pulex]